MVFTFYCNDVNDLADCAKLVDKGGVIIFPTDTVFGIGCDPTNEISVLKLYKIKNRSLSKILPLLTFSKTMVTKVAQINSAAQILMDLFWPGQLTIIMKAKEDNIGLSKYVTDDLNRSIALRIPNNDCLQDLIKATRCKFLVGTSANLSQQPSSNKLLKINTELISKCDAIFMDNTHKKKLEKVDKTTKSKSITIGKAMGASDTDTDTYTSNLKSESTIVDITNELKPRIIREGAVPKDKIIDALKIIS